MSATVKYAFRESRAGAGAPKRLQAGAAAVLHEKVPRVARLLALAHKFQRMLDSGEVNSMAELARLGRVSRARITQIMDLLMLAPEIQEEVLRGGSAGSLPALTLRELLVFAHETDWCEQRAACRRCTAERGREAA